MTMTSAKRPLVLIGGGEHARVVLDAALAEGTWDVIGYIDVAPSDSIGATGIPYLGPDDAATRLPITAVIAVGGERPDLRRAIVARYLDERVTWATIRHPSAVVAPSAHLGAGTVVLAAAVVNPHAFLDLHVIVNTAAIVEHDARLGSFVHVAPNSTIGGGAVLGAGVFVGLGATIRDHVEVGPDAFVGMASAVIRDVPKGLTVVGNPARTIASRSA
jgi:sugar O-acyltransferase (sialic acid O-acetyltransferase NeuD family)